MKSSGENGKKNLPMNLQLIGEFFFAGLICLENFSNGVVNRIRNFILGLITIDDDNLHTLFLVHLYSTMEIIVYFFWCTIKLFMLVSSSLTRAFLNPTSGKATLRYLRILSAVTSGGTSMKK